MIFELAANTLKSQYQSHQIFNTTKENCKRLDCENSIFKNISWSYVAVILNRIEKWNRYYWIGSVGIQNMYKTSLETDTFFDFQKMPELNKVVLLYSPTAKYMIKMDYENGDGEIKLPDKNATTKKDWDWYKFEFYNHDRLVEIANNYETKKPTIIKKKTKSGLDYYEANISYEIKPPKVISGIKRVLGVDPLSEFKKTKIAISAYLCAVSPVRYVSECIELT